MRKAGKPTREKRLKAQERIRRYRGRLRSSKGLVRDCNLSGVPGLRTTIRKVHGSYFIPFNAAMRTLTGLMPGDRVKVIAEPRLIILTPLKGNKKRSRRPA